MSLQKIKRQSKQAAWTKVVTRISLCGLLGIAFMATGCVSMTPGYSAPPVAPESANPNAPTYKVILSNGRKPQVFTGRLNKPVTVQQALLESGATAKFKTMRVDVARVIQGSGEVLKMPVKYDTDGKIFDEYDYAVHPGDEILVRPAKSSNLFSAMMGK